MEEDQIIDKLEKEIQKKQKRIQQVKKRKNEKIRKARTRRMIILGGMIEKSLDMKLEDDDLDVIATIIEKNKHRFISDILQKREQIEQQKQEIFETERKESI